MRIAFYAPLKPPDHVVPSGDRRVARLLIAALEKTGHEVEVMSRLISRDPEGNQERQGRLEALGGRLAERLVRRLGQRPEAERPALWLTYHLYYKAPDYIGPLVCQALQIPYVVAEASVAGKRAGGPWDRGHRVTLNALALARRVITLNPADAAGLPEAHKVALIKPYLETAPYAAAAEDRDQHRQALAKRLALDPEIPWLLTVAMMRPGDKLDSYRFLGQALKEMTSKPWQLLVVGDGSARREVERALDNLGDRRVRYLGEQAGTALPPLYAAADLLVWPAVREAYGMALLEAQASGLPVVAGREGGVASLVHDDVTGCLTPPGDFEAFAATIGALLDNPARRAGMRETALATTARDHTLAAGAAALDRCLKQVVAES